MNSSLADVLDEDGSGEIDFKEFVEGITTLGVLGDREAKLKFAFKIYDMDKDGFISNGELFQVLKTMVGNNLKNEQLQQLVDRTINSVDKNQDGKISFEEFCKFLEKSDIDKKLTLQVPV